MQKIAYAFLDLRPHEFWKLTFAEFNLMVEGYQMRDKKGYQKLAQHASWVTAPHLKRPIKPEKLLGQDNEGKEKETTTPEYTKQYLDELEAEFQN